MSISKDVEAATGREHYIMECVADALFLAIRNFHKRMVVKNIAEVDAAGRYITIPLACRGQTMPSRTLYGCNIYTNGVGITLFVHYQRLWKASNRGWAEARYPAFLL